MSRDNDNQRLAQPKPCGGYAFIKCYELLALWGCYLDGDLQLFDVRVAFALRELAKTRLHLANGEHRRYQIEELVKLTRGKPAQIRRSLSALESLGVAKIRKKCIQFSFGEAFREATARERVRGMMAATSNHRRKIPMPRRMLRLLATTRSPLSSLLCLVKACVASTTAAVPVTLSARVSLPG